MSADHHSLFQLGPDETPYRKLTSGGVRLEKALGREMLVVEREALALIAEAAMIDINHLLRPGHLAQLAKILDDPEATSNDKFVAYDLLKNANIAAGGVLPMCQDTGTAIVMGKKGRRVFTEGDDEAPSPRASATPMRRRTCAIPSWRRSRMFEEVNTGDNLPAQIEIYAEGEDAYKFLFIAKGGGSANKTFLFQGTPSLLTHERLVAFLREKILTLGTAACPPYHLAIVIGGTRAELNLKTVKLASAHYLDSCRPRRRGRPRLPRSRDRGRDPTLTQSSGVGAQFGGKYFCHDVRVIRLPRHGASLPIGLGVSCSADRQALGKINRDGVFLEELEHDPARFLPAVDEAALGGPVVKIDLNRPMTEILAELTKYPIRTRALADRADDRRARPRPRQDPRAAGRAAKRCRNISATIRSITPGPAKTPAGIRLGLVRPDDGGADGFLRRPVPGGGRLDGDARQGQSLAEVREACAKHGGFYLGSIGGAAARLAQDCIRKVEVLEYPELGMEAVWRIEVEDFPAFIVIDDKGNDFFKELNLG